ncbi:hypothetical protein P5673_012268 [Acropora cervicornis]|uniref:Uncharacterized protein n=1 Tax=Acropora cervicornis TaxID=6130 RepID=A0AAD9V7X8_ACRCE|nr:hypothetical protein P5673_012268 [Acropora cervicornis]
MDDNDSRPLPYHVCSRRELFMIAQNNGGDGGDDGDNFFSEYTSHRKMNVLRLRGGCSSLEKKLVNSNNGVADRESKWEKFQLFCRGSEN